MLTNNLIIYVALIVIIGVQDCSPLKCFQCEYRKREGKVTRGSSECENVTSSDTTSHFLKNCEDPSNNKRCFTAVLKDKRKGTDVYELHRGCTGSKPSGCHSLDAPPFPEGRECVCKKDACNSKEQEQDSDASCAANTVILSTLLLILLVTFLHPLQQIS